MPRRVSTPEERERAIAVYLETGGDLDAAAAAVPWSRGWVLQQVCKAAVSVNPTPRWPASLARRAIELYTGGMTTREVASELADESGRGPSRQWVLDRLRERGIRRRSRGEYNRIKAERRTGRNYTLLEQLARGLRAKRWSVRRIALHLRLPRRTVAHWIRKAEGKLDGREAQRIATWEADTPDARKRRAKRVRVIQLRQLGKTYAEISAATGLSGPTIGLYLRKAGMTKTHKRRARA